MFGVCLSLAAWFFWHFRCRSCAAAVGKFNQALLYAVHERTYDLPLIIIISRFFFISIAHCLIFLDTYHVWYIILMKLMLFKDRFIIICGKSFSVFCFFLCVTRLNVAVDETKWKKPWRTVTTSNFKIGNNTFDIVSLLRFVSFNLFCDKRAQVLP